MVEVNKELIRKTQISEYYTEVNTGKNVHDHLKNLSVSEIKEINYRDRLPFDVLCFNLNGEGNVGSIVRSALLHGAGKVHIFGLKKFDRRGTVGTYHYIDVIGHDGICSHDLSKFDQNVFKSIIQSENYLPVFIEQGGVSLENFKFKRPNTMNFEKILLISGNETNGIPEEFMIDSTVVSIPQRGVIRSFNVSNAFNIVVWEMRKQLMWF